MVMVSTKTDIHKKTDYHGQKNLIWISCPLSILAFLKQLKKKKKKGESVWSAQDSNLTLETSLESSGCVREVQGNGVHYTEQ